MSSNSGNKEEIIQTKKIGIIGGGAAGLATARAFLRENESNHNTNYHVTVFESRDSIGGIWKYEDQTNAEKNRPMYRNLRTNLPKELMAYRELPWGGDGEASYVTHRQVLEYLEAYADEFDLIKCINFGSSVKQLKVLENEQISLEWTNSKSADETHTEIFDHISVCNGHYARPAIPKLKGLDNFRGSVIHAIEYDNAQPFADKTVLCVGAKPSGLDISREIGLVAKKVYLSDSACDKMQTFGNVSVMPRMQSVDETGVVCFSSPRSTEETHVVDGIDSIVFCSGYDYDFPFINDDSNLELEFTPGERRVQPLYEQTWHARYPSVSFIGIPHSIVPFPLCEIQAAAVVSQTRQQIINPLPSLSDRLAAASKDANSGGPNRTRVQDTHNLASHQWDFCRRLAKISGDDDDEMEQFISTNKALYDRSGKERKSMIPGGEDVYRETRFRRDDENETYEILYSAAEVTV